jgi:hypothetical protein
MANDDRQMKKDEWRAKYREQRIHRDPDTPRPGPERVRREGRRMVDQKPNSRPKPSAIHSWIIGSIVLLVMFAIPLGVMIMGGRSVWSLLRPRLAPISTLCSDASSAEELIQACKVLAEKASKGRLDPAERAEAACALIPLLKSSQSLTREEELTRGYQYRDLAGRVRHVPGQTVARTYYVSDVALDALRAISGQNFGKNVSAWEAWFARPH